MNDSQLQSWVEQISKQYFDRPFLHRATFNHRLRSTGGRYFTTSHDIEISWRQYECYGREEVEKIIKHELCHYHLHIMKRGYRHRDADFKQWLQAVGGSRFCRAMPGGKVKEPYRYRLGCLGCGTEYVRKRKVNVAKYVCGKCKGKLKLLEHLE